MAVYNGQRYLSEALEGLLAQTWRDFELVVVDDASTDETPAILRSYARRDARILLLRNERNLNLAASLNRGLRACRAPLIARADDDDQYDPRRLEIQTRYMQTFPDVDVLASAYWRTGPSGEPRFLYQPPMDHDRITFHLLWGCCICHSAVVFRREPVVTAGGYDEGFAVAQDYELWTRLARDHKFAIVPNALVRVRDHDRSSTAVQRPLQNKCADSISRHLLERYMGQTVDAGEARAWRIVLSAIQSVEPLEVPAALRLLHDVVRTARLREKPSTVQWAIGYAAASLVRQSYYLTYTAPHTSWKLLVEALSLRRSSTFHLATVRQVARLLARPLRGPKEQRS
jgi:glycosyltransferase involved in cell wall biosynthesis